MAAVIVRLECADTGEADQLAAAVRDAGVLSYQAREDGRTIFSHVTETTVEP